MNVSVVVPWVAGDPWRAQAWAWVKARFAETQWEVVTGTCLDGPFNRSAAILDGARHASGDVFVVADADVWCDPTEAVERATENGWAVPHTLIHRLSKESTVQVLTGSDWRGLPLSEDNPQDSKPYRGNETGTLVVLARDVLFDVPPDPRFVGWGQEDQAWGMALRTLVGAPWRGPDDLVHLWHPPQPRQSRVVGSSANMDLLRRYQAARRRPDAMRSLVDEARSAVAA